MNCFNHPDRPALGICKSCNKGLCQDCLTEVPDGLACKNKCEDRVRIMNLIIESSKKTLSTSNLVLKSQRLFLFALGGFFILWGIVLVLSGKIGAGVLPFGIGLLFVIIGIWRFRKSLRYPEIK